MIDSPAGELIRIIDIDRFQSAYRVRLARNGSGIEWLSMIVAKAIENAGGHQTRAAERLDVTQPYLARLVRQLGIRRGE